MPPTIPVTTSKSHQQDAAINLSRLLDKLEIRHAYIGGFAWSLLGSRRPTEMSLIPFFAIPSLIFPCGHDIDVLLETSDAIAVREAIIAADAHFASYYLNLYFVPDMAQTTEPIDVLSRLQQSRHNVQVETLIAGKLGLPTVPEPVLRVPEASSVRILHPSILILTKLNRWSKSFTSTRPKTIRKSASDANDIDFMIRWLVSQGMTIAFAKYTGRDRPVLLTLVRAYWDYKLIEQDSEIIKLLADVLESADCEEITAAQAREGNLAEIQQANSLPPPID